MNNQFVEEYVSPQIVKWAMSHEGILCQSGDFDPYAGENSDNYQELF